MATDGLFLALVHPIGLVLIAIAIGLPCTLWVRMVRSSQLPHRGRIILMAYAAALSGLLVSSAASSYLEFSSRAASGMLQEAQRWSIVPGWTIYVMVLALLVVLPLLAFVGVPVSAFLVRRSRLSVWTATGALFGAFLLSVLLLWSFPSNEWHRTHRLDSLFLIARELLSAFAIVGGAFAGAILAQVKSAARQRT